MKLTKYYFFDFKKILKHSTSFILLLFIVFSMINFSFISNANAVSWLDKVSDGGLDQVGTVYGQDKSQPSKAIIVVASTVNIVLGLLGIIFLILILYAGFNWMTAGGEEEKVTKAKETITRAVIGLIIILASLAISNLVISQIISATK
ncbi:MAG: hypothetical protein AAB530_00605 [Patescibacteria group bacterium]